MKGFLVIVLGVFLPAMVFAYAGGDAGWAERGNGKEYIPPSCQLNLNPGESIVPGLPHQRGDDLNPHTPTECEDYGIPTIGRGPLKINN